MTGTTLEHDWYTTETREEIYKEIVSAVKELHIALGAGEDRATRLANIHAVKNTNKEFINRRLNPPKVVDEMLYDTIDRYEKELKQGQENYDKLWDMYSELKKELGNRTCESCKHFKLDYFEPNRGTCRNKNVPTTGYMVDCDYGCNRYEAKENK